MANSIDFQFPSVHIGFGNTMYIYVVVDKDEELKICLRLVLNDDDDVRIILLSQKEWIFLTSELMDSYVQLATKEIETRNETYKEDIISNLTSVKGYKYDSESENYRHQFRIGPKLFVNVGGCEANICITGANSWQKNLSPSNFIFMNKRTWRFLRKKYSTLSSLIPHFPLNKNKTPVYSARRIS